MSTQNLTEEKHIFLKPVAYNDTDKTVVLNYRIIIELETTKESLTTKTRFYFYTYAEDGLFDEIDYAKEYIQSYINHYEDKAATHSWSVELIGPVSRLEQLEAEGQIIY